MFEVINFTVLLVFVYSLSKYYKICNLYILFFIIHLLSIFTFNNFLFPPSYMPDQLEYLRVAQNVRNFDFLNSENFTHGYTVYISSIFFGLFPLPFINSVYSIGMINFALYYLLFIFMYKNRMFNSKIQIYFYFFYPSLLLYSSLALRDMLVFFIMFFLLYFLLIKKNSIITLLISVSLMYLKIINFLIFVISLFSMIDIKKIKHILFLTSLALILWINFIDYFTLERLNFYRLDYFTQNSLQKQEVFLPYTSYWEVIKQAIPKAIYMFFRPIPWHEFSYLKLLQFLENCLTFLFIIFIWYKNIQLRILKNKEVIFLNCFLIIALIVYGLVIYNSGTAVRYKFPFIAIYILYSFYFIFQKQESIDKDCKND